MNALRLSAALAALTALFTAAVALGACSEGPSLTFPDCTSPIIGEIGADGGPDPCHCDPPPSANLVACACLSGNQQEVAEYHQCMTIYGLETADGGDAGGPIPGTCSGACWPLPPPGWAPVLLWLGAANDTPLCPDAAPTVVYDGQASGTFALGCTSNASGTCPGLGDVCAPTSASPFRPCVMHDGAADCVSLGPYPEPHVFNAGGGNQPLLPTTFCCTSSPMTQ